MRRRNIHSIRKSLNNLCVFLQEEYSINYGGCCFIASILAKHLEKIGIKYELVIYEHTRKNIPEIKKELANRKINKGYFNSITGFNTCNHYCLNIIGAGYVNDLGDFDHCVQHIITEINYKDLKWIYKHGDWNDVYNTDFNTEIKGIVKEFFKKYERKN